MKPLESSKIRGEFFSYSLEVLGEPVAYAVLCEFKEGDATTISSWRLKLLTGSYLLM